MYRRKDSPEDIAIQRELMAKANLSMEILGYSFKTYGSGEYLNLIPPKAITILKRAKARCIDDTV